MEKLTVEMLSPYLPYKVKGKFKDDKELYILTGANAFTEMVEVNTSDELFCTSGSMDDFKPILRPMSADLMDYTLLNSDTLFYKEFSIDTRHDIAIGKFNAYGVRYSDILLLVSNHFDVFRLIEKGLAIDINTI